MIIKFPLYCNPGGENRTIHTYLPNNYYNSDERYPVVYMFDGHNLFYDCDATYGKSWGLANFLDNWKKNIIIVGLECSHHGHERLSEFFPFSMTYCARIWRDSPFPFVETHGNSVFLCRKHGQWCAGSMSTDTRPRLEGECFLCKYNICADSD